MVDAVLCLVARLKSFVRLALVYLVTASGLGCGGYSLEDDITRYQSRLAKVLDSQITEMAAIEPLSYPPLRDLQNQLLTSSIAIQDFHAIQNCRANLLIAQRNTPLGRTQLPSKRYSYEVQLISALQDCLAQEAPGNAKLQDWIVNKTANLPLVWANMIQTSDEIKTAFSSNGAFLGQSSSAALSDTQHALAYLLALESGENVNLTELEQHLKQLAQHKLPAKVWRSQRLLAQELDRTTQWLVSLDPAKQCINGQPSQQLRYLRNVFQLFFIEKIQPLASQLNHIQYQLNPLYQQFSHSPDLKPRFKALLTQQQQEFKVYQEAMSRHITFWQKLLARCGLSPTANSR